MPLPTTVNPEPVLLPLSSFNTPLAVAALLLVKPYRKFVAVTAKLEVSTAFLAKKDPEVMYVAEQVEATVVHNIPPASGKVIELFAVGVVKPTVVLNAPFVAVNVLAELPCTKNGVVVRPTVTELAVPVPIPSATAVAVSTNGACKLVAACTLPVTLSEPD